MTAELLPSPQSNKPSVKLFLIAAAIIAATLVAVEDWHLLFAYGRNEPLGRDFVIFWRAAVLIWNGDFATVFDPWQFSRAFQGAPSGPLLSFTPFPYPPLAVWFIAPLAGLPYAVAWPTWLVVTFAGFALTLRRFFATRLNWLLVLVTAPAGLVNIADGQNGFLSAALLCGGLLNLERRPILAGVLIGLLTFKPQLGVLLPFVLLAGGYFRVFAASAATTLALFAFSTVWLGWDSWTLYFQTGMPEQRSLLETGIGPFMAMVPSFFMSARMLGLPVWAAYGLQGIVAVVVVIACCWAIRQKATPLELRIAVVMVGVAVAPPYCFNYDLTIVTAALVLAWTQCENLIASDRIVFALSWVLPAVMVVLGYANLPIAPIILLAQFAVLLRALMVPATVSVSADARSAVA